MKLVTPYLRTARLAQRYASTQAVKHPSWFLRMVENNEYSLPRLPVPQLNDTLERYLRSVQPLVTPAEFKEHKKLLEDFGLGKNRSIARQLQDDLIKEEFANAMGRAYPYSYIEAWWDKMYLGGRYPNPINVNPGYGLIEESPGSALADPLVRTSTFVVSLMKWFEKMKRGQLEQDPKQCMSSLAKQLGTAKIPKPNCDILQFHPQSNHIIVLYKNVFYKIDVLRGKQVIDRHALEAQLHSILKQPIKDDPNIAVLTSEDRDIWASARATIIADGNEASITAIDSALFVLVLDDKSYSGSQRTAMTLHGDNGKDRWFDKLQILANVSDGHLAVNFEHTFSDGTAWNRWLHEVWHDMRGSNSGFSPLPMMESFTNHVSSSSSSPAPLKLTWNISPDVQKAIAAAENRAAKDVANVETTMLSFSGFGKNTIKRWELSPDGVLQMAFQLAFFRENQRMAPTYESCSTRAFFHGRTETIRSATMEALAFVSAVTSNDAPVSTQRALLTAAVKQHVVLAKEAQQGLGCDRHLTMLHEMAHHRPQHERTKEVHPFWTHPIKIRSSHFQLSTSNVTMPFLEYFCFGPVVPSGYGLGYLIQKDHVPIAITSFKDCKTTKSATFGKSIADALTTIRSIAEAQ
jgi:hypothetical protein